MNDSHYPTDLTDSQWNELQPLLPKPKRRGRPRSNLRRILNGIFYLVRAGCAWRMLPKDFGPWKTVYDYFRRWSRDGTWAALNEVLRAVARALIGKQTQPTAAILDSQSVRSADQAGERGYDAAKKIKGRKRHVLVDTLGLLLWVCVTPAQVTERHGGRLLLGSVFGWLNRLRTIWADGGYSGEDFAQWISRQRQERPVHLQVVNRCPDQKGFAVLPKRWIVERTFAWLMKNRRLVRDYEVKTEHAECWLYVAMLALMLRRVA